MAALDRVLQALGSHVLGRVAALSVSAQQHGSIFWTRRGLEKLGYLQSPLPPQDQLAGAFVEDLAPVWMDTSTSAECAEMARRVGGSSRVADVTGSAYAIRAQRPPRDPPTPPPSPPPLAGPTSASRGTRSPSASSSHGTGTRARGYPS